MVQKATEEWFADTEAPQSTEEAVQDDGDGDGENFEHLGFESQFRLLAMCSIVD